MKSRNSILNRKNSSKKKIIAKKGIIDVQFNWIFVMIAGTVIFLFIISIAIMQKHNADAQAGAAVVGQITTLLKGKQQTANVYSEITIPSTELTFRCDADTEYFSFKIADSERVSLPQEIIFAPQELDTNKIQTWSQAFTVGFPVGVFTYVTTADSIIILYNNTSPYSIALFKELSDNVTKKYANNLNDIAEHSNNYKRVKVVCFDGFGCPSISPSGADYDYVNISVSASTIQGTATAFTQFDYGTIQFHKKGVAGTTIQPFLTPTGLYGAIFSDDSAYYTCQMSRALKQFEIKRQLIASRMSMIQNAPIPVECRNKINVTLENSVIPMQNLIFNSAGIADLNSKMLQVDKGNIFLKLSSCPMFY